MIPIALPIHQKLNFGIKQRFQMRRIERDGTFVRNRFDKIEGQFKCKQDAEDFCLVLLIDGIVKGSPSLSIERRHLLYLLSAVAFTRLASLRKSSDVTTPTWWWTCTVQEN